MKLQKVVAIPAIALAAGLSLAACGSVKAPAAAPPVTHTVTAKPAPTTAKPTTAAPRPGPAPVAQVPAPSFTNAVAVLDQYYQDITNQDYSAAWAMGGSNIAAENGQTYDSWVAGYANTASITLDSGGTWNNGTVSVDLTATETDGTVQTYAGQYYVNSGGIIQSGTMTLTSGGDAAAPAAPSGLTSCGDDLYVNADASCPFAQNVEANYTGLGPDYASSPVTEENYTMNCVAGYGNLNGGDSVVCTGGDNALVEWGAN
jgi:hypothetical protein